MSFERPLNASLSARRPQAPTHRWTDADKAALRAVVEEAKGSPACPPIHRLAMERLGLDTPTQAKGMMQRLGIRLGRTGGPRRFGDHHRQAWALHRQGRRWVAIPALIGRPDIAASTLRAACARYARAGLFGP